MLASTAALLVCLVSADPVTVTKLDGSVLQGDLVAFSTSQIEVTTDSGPSAIPADQLLSIQWDRQALPPATDVQSVPIVMTVIDGSVLTLSSLSVEGDDVTAVSKLTPDPLTFSRKLVHHVRLGALDDSLKANWDDLLSRNSKDDLLIFRKENVLDYVGGVVGTVAEDKVTLIVRNRELATPRERVFGFIYADRSPPREKLVAEVGLTSGDRWQGATISRSDTGWDIKLRCGLALTAPVESVNLIDFGGGRLRYLSDLVYDDSGSQDPNPERPGGSVVWYVSNDSPIGLGLKGMPLKVGKEEFRRGVWLHSGAVVRYRVNREYRKLQTVAGFELSDRDRMPAFDPKAKLVIEGDGKELYAKEFAWNDPAEPLELDLTDVRELTVKVVSLGKHKGILERIALGNARLVK